MTLFDELVALAKDYEQWEADLVLSDEAWANGRDGMPLLTEDFYDELMVLQKKRNALMKKVKGEEG